jgi:hypothetical protein
MINPTDTDTAGGTATLPPPSEQRAANTASRFHIPGDKIALETADLPEAQREAIRWAAGYCRSKNLHVAEFAALLKKPNGEPYSKDSVVHMFTGGRDESSLVPMVAAIERLRRVEDERAEQARAPFVETRLAKRIFALCRKAFLRQKMVFLFGDSQIGKTTALEEYARRHNHGETKYVRMSTGGTLCDFLRELAEVLGIPAGNAIQDLKRRILQCFDSRMLLIVDECEECLRESRYGVRGLDTLNFIREIHDKRKCGVVLAGANVFRQRLYHGGHAPSMLRLVRRGMPPLQLPNVPGQADLATFAAHFGLPPAGKDVIGVRVLEVDDDGNEKRTPVEASPLDLQTKVVKEHGLGRWLMILTEASDTARERRKTISWGFVLHAWHTFVTSETYNPDAELKEAG